MNQLIRKIAEMAESIETDYMHDDVYIDRPTKWVIYFKDQIFEEKITIELKPTCDVGKDGAFPKMSVYIMIGDSIYWSDILRKGEEIAELCESVNLLCRKVRDMREKRRKELFKEFQGAVE